MRNQLYFIPITALLLAFWISEGSGSKPNRDSEGSKQLRLESVDDIGSCCQGEAEKPEHARTQVVHEQGLMVDEETYREWKELATRRTDVPRANILLSAEESAFLPLAPIITKRFDGTDQVQAGGGFPPDTNIAVSKTSVLEAVNFVYRLSTKSNSNVLLTPINTFHKRAGQFLFDPRVFYDRFSDRFIVVALEFNDHPQTSFIHLAVSRNGSPADFNASWCFYKIPGKIQASWSDYPNVGMNEKWLVITVNLFKFAGNQFTKAVIKAIDLTALANNASSCPKLKAFTFSDTIGSIYPAQYHTASGQPDHPLFMLASFNAATASSYFLYKVAGAGNPSISKSTLPTTATYGIPPEAFQKGGGKLLNTGDARMIDVESRNDALFFSHSTVCNFGARPSGANSNESCVRVSKLSISGTPTLQYQLTIGGGDNNFFWFPGIGVNSSEDVALIFQESGKTRSLGLGHSGKKGPAANFVPFKIIKQGACRLENLDTADRNRTGDYVGVHVDPSDDKSFWYAAEVSKKFGTNCGWGTFIVQTH